MSLTFKLQSFSVLVRNKRQSLIVACTYKFIINKKGTDCKDIFTVVNTYSHLVTAPFKAKMEKGFPVALVTCWICPQHRTFPYSAFVRYDMYAFL